MYKVNVGSYIFHTEKQLTPSGFYYYFGKQVESKIINSLYRFKKATLKIIIEDAVIQEDFTEKDFYIGIYRKLYNCFHCFHPSCSYRTIDNVGLLRVELETNNSNNVLYEEVEIKTNNITEVKYSEVKEI
jgi:hypothetical protein